MGKDKFENEDLIKHGWETDVWFHVDNLSSAHVYLRMLPHQSWDNLPEEILIDTAQLCKANSIQGNKRDNITIIYTPHANLKKTAGMETGQVTFYSQKKVKKIHIATRENAIINRLMKTRQELYPDLAAEKIQHEKLQRAHSRKEEKKIKEAEIKRIEEERKQKDRKNYKDVKVEEKLTSNIRNLDLKEGKTEKDLVDEFEEDFM